MQKLFIFSSLVLVTACSTTSQTETGKATGSAGFRHPQSTTFQAAVTCEGLKSPQEEESLKAEFSEDLYVARLSISKGKTVLFSGFNQEKCLLDAGRISCEIPTDGVSYTVAIWKKDGKNVASVVPTNSMEIPSFLTCDR